MRYRSDGTLAIYTRDLLRAALAIQVLLLMVALLEFVEFDTGFARPAIAAFYLAFIPGGVIALALRMGHSPSSFVVYALGLSLSLVMAVGVLLSLVLPPLGIPRPLSTGPLTVAFALVVGVAGFLVYRQEQTLLFEIRTESLFSPLPMALLLLPPASILGTAVIKQGQNLPLLVLLLVISILPFVFVILWNADRWGAICVWTISVALVFHGELWPFKNGHQLTQITLNQGRWIPNQAGVGGSLLSNGVLYPVFAILTDLSMSIEWGTVNPFLMSFIPLVLFEAFRRETSAVTAMIGACLFMFSFPFYTLFPGGGRVGTPILFLALMGLAIVDERNGSPLRNALILIFATGVAVSHYGTAWVVMIALFVSVAVFYGIRFADAVRSDRHGGLRSDLIRIKSRLFSKILSPSVVAFYTVFSLAWYLYTGLGGKFQTLPNHVVKGIERIFYSTDITGDAVRSATKEYGSTAVAYSRMLYVLFGVLMGLGIVFLLLRRLYNSDRIISDEFLALGTGFLSMLGAAFLPFSSGFNTARVMMIIFTFSAPFAVLGLQSTFEISSKWIKILDNEGGRISSVAPSLVAVLLSLFLMLNAGVVSATVTNDFAPSNTLLQKQLLDSDNPVEQMKAGMCTECAIQLHVWIWNYRDQETPVYADFQTVGQVDYHRGSITESTGTIPSKGAYESLSKVFNGTDEPSYLLLTPHNIQTGVVLIGGKYNWTSMGGLQDTFHNSSRIYHSKDAIVYLTSDGDLNGGTEISGTNETNA